MKAILLVVLGLAATAMYAQERVSYDWESTRVPQPRTDGKTVDEEIVRMHQQYDYYWKGDQLQMLRTSHRITWVGNAEAIQRNNKIYISMNNVIEIVELKARAISPDGKVVNFDKNNLKEIPDEDTDNTYRIFAIEGAEVNSEIEFLYTLRQEAVLFEGCYFQFETPLRQATVVLTSPSHLQFDFRTYNHNGKIESDTLAGKNRYRLAAENVPALARESFSYFDANRARVDFKLAYNTSSGSARLNTWPEAGKRFYSRLTKTDPETEKLLVKLVKTIKDKPNADPVSRIKNVEHVLKSSIRVISPASDPQLSELPWVLQYKQASKQAMTHLMALVYARLKIPAQIVITCNRETAKFDGTFDSWGFLDEYLLYFPEVNGFIEPGATELRYPLVSPRYTATRGLFLEPVVVGPISSAITWVRDIPALPYTAFTDDLDITVTFDESMETNTIVHRRDFAGYDGAGVALFYDQMSSDQREKFVAELFRDNIPDIKIQKWNVSKYEKEHVTHFVIEATYTTNHFIEKAGSRILFKAGELIGPQTEMYRDEHRMTPVENPYNRGYNRVIKVKLPPGYKASNVESLVINVLYNDGDYVPFSFVSTAELKNDLLTIHADEFYKEVYAPLERYEDFRKVINAAADFNKATVVLSK